MEKTLYIGIDISKEKFDTSITFNTSGIIACDVFENNGQGFKKLINWVNKHAKKLKCQLSHYCIEATGIYHEELTEYLQEEKNTIVSVINPFQSKAFANSQLLRTKNDKVDASMLARYCAMNQPKATPKTPEEIKTLKILVRSLSYLVDSRAREKTKLESIKDKDVKKLTDDRIKFLSGQIQQTEKLIKNLVKKHQQIKEDVKLLMSIPGIGDRTAWTILVEIIQGEDIPIKSQIAHAGLAPQQYLSGKSVKGKPKICKTGNSNLRKCLYMPAMSAGKHNPILKEFKERLLSNDKLKMVALIASMRKLLTIALGVLKTQKPFDPDWANKKQMEFAAAT